MATNEQTDVAALGSGVVGVAVTMLVDDGPFDPLGTMVCITLILVIVSYIGGHDRTWLKRIAFGAVLGILTIPIVGVYLETSTDLTRSSVQWPEMAKTWVTAGALAVLLDWGAARWRNGKSA